MKLAVIADPHYYSPSLGTSGKAYRLRSESDQKFLAESGAVLEAALGEIIRSDAEVILIAGDLSNDGERVSHEEVRDILRRAAKQKKICCITSTHDWCSDENPRRYEGDRVYHDVPTVPKEELFDFYSEFCADERASVFTTPQGFTSAEYAFGGVTVLAVNDDSNGKGKAGYPDELLGWVRERCLAAKGRGDRVIVMEHHLAMPGISEMINGGQMIGDSETVCEFLADIGVDLVICGHSHMQRVSQYLSTGGRVLTQLNAGSICGWPSPINYVTADSRGVRIDVEYLKGFEYEGRRYTAAFIREHSLGVLLRPLYAAARSRDAFCERLAALGVKEPENMIGTVYPVIKRLCSFILESDVGRFCRVVNRLTFGRYREIFDPGDAASTPMLYYVSEIFLNVFDGTRFTLKKTDNVYRMVAFILLKPELLLGRLPMDTDCLIKLLKSVRGIADKLMLEPAEGREHFVFND